MASRKRLVLPALVCLLLVLTPGHSFTIDVYKNGERVNRYEERNAEAEDRAIDISVSGIRGQMHYAMPFRNACEPVNSTNTTAGDLNWFALIDNYLDCYDLQATYLQEAGYSLMIAYAPNGVGLATVASIPRCLVSNLDFITFLRNYTVLELSPHADQYVIKVKGTDYLMYEELFLIFGGILLGAVGISVVLFCCSICCRAVMRKWRHRALSRWRIRQLPKRRYRKEKETIESCSICLEDFKNGDKLRVLPCDHIFHPKCVDEWLQKWNRICPLCKSTITRRGGGRSVDTATSSSTTADVDLEQSHLLQRESGERDEEGEGRREGGSRSSDPDTYGATGHTLNPLSDAVTDQEDPFSRNQSEVIRTALPSSLPESSPMMERSPEHDLNFGSSSEPLVTYRV